MTTYQILYGLSLVVTVLLAVWTGISTTGGDRLGLTPTVMAWLTVLFGALGVLNGFLPPLQRRPTSEDNTGPRSDPDPMPRDR